MYEMYYSDKEGLNIGYKEQTTSAENIQAQDKFP